MVKQYLVVFISIFFDVLSFAILAKILSSWVPVTRSHPVVKFLDDVTKPVLDLAAKITPKTGMIDFSPVIALLALDFLKALILALLR